MDVDAKRAELESQKLGLENYLQHPVTVEVIRDLDEQSERLVRQLCNEPIRDIESFFNHFESVGHLRGLRRAKALLTTNLENIKEELGELNASST